ncbi:MAG: radical SAM-associated putative lipoprotein [Bacteroidota bacterium]
MKPFNSNVYVRLYLKLLGLLGALFFVSCDRGNDGIIAMYGAPVNGYKEVRFHGTVKSADSLQVLPDLNVDFFSDQMRILFTSTDLGGEYSFVQGVYEGEKYRLKVSDTDSVANNGQFEAKEIEIVISGRDIGDKEHKADILLKRK